MKKEILFKVMSILVMIWITMTSSSWAALVVTDEIRSWAKQVVSQERGLKAVSAPNTVAVLDFYNKTQWAALDPVQKGIALMLITDLSRIKSIQLVERARLIAICDELKLSKSSLIEESTRSRLGKLLGAGHLVGGDIFKGRTDEFQLNSILLEVKNEDVVGRASVQGKFLEGIFEMEKKILFDIVKELNLKLSSGEEEKLKRPLTNNLDALLNLFQALEFSDNGDFVGASECLKKALEKDPNLTLAEEFLAEITELTGSKGYSEEFFSEGNSQPQTDIGEKDDPHDRANAADTDGDGYAVDNGDCNDHDPSICPTCPEIPYDGIDQNCDGSDLTDVDGDGYNAVQAGGDDCDDNNPGICPTCSEIPYDGIDQNCDGSDLTDVDGDGHNAVQAGGDDCDDNNPGICPTCSEIPYDGIDQNCDGSDLTDVDGDGHNAVQAGGDDCDDNNPGICPTCSEIPYDGIDQNCDGSDLTDVDGDGYNAVQVGGDDCDDNNPSICPTCSEIPYDGIDQNCDGSDLTDVDGDGYNAVQAGGDDCDDNNPGICPTCSEIPYDGIDQNCDGSDLTDVDGDGHNAVQAGGDDCDDNNPGICPTCSEIPYDGIDQNCDGSDLTDVDGDGYNAVQVGGDDCDDNNPSICPTCSEIPYDGIDQNCDGSDLTDVDGDGHNAVQVGGDDCDDNNPDLYAAQSWYRDVDGDHYSNGEIIIQCDRPAGFYPDSELIAISGDCDDNDPSVNPGRTEAPYNNKDDDCDPSTPDGNYTGGDQPPIVDMDSLAMARGNYSTDSSVAGRVHNGYYTPGGLSGGSPEPDGDYPGIEQWPVTWGGPYKYGLQTVGRYFDQENETFENSVLLLNATHNLINQYPFLAYVVQVEEDRLNEKTIEMYQKADKYADLDIIKDQLQCDDILARDAMLTQQADAQAGRVLRDHNGDWVRVQQYILRPDTQTVQVLNVCLRGSGANSGISTMDFTTKFTQGYALNYDVSALNWDSWLTTLSDESGKYIETSGPMYPELASMSVEFKNPAGESLRESRTFAGKIIVEMPFAVQQITTEELELVNSSGTLELYGHDYVSGNDYPSGNFYTVGLEWGGFDYVMPTGSIRARFYSLDDYGQADAEGVGGIYDIWAAFKVGLSSSPEFFTNNRNLEIVLSNGTDTNFYAQDTDIVYIPMSRMVWKYKEQPIW